MRRLLVVLSLVMMSGSTSAEATRVGCKAAVNFLIQQGDVVHSLSRPIYELTQQGLESNHPKRFLARVGAISSEVDFQTQGYDFQVQSVLEICKL